MLKRGKQIPIKKVPKIKKRTPEKQVSYLLEQTDLESLRKAKQFSENLLKYQWKYYYELAQQRNEIIDKIKSALLQDVTEKYVFKKWQRAVRWKYSLHPMSTVGSRVFVGQRFNYGDEINAELPGGFPCLYIASDKDTALQETLGQSQGNVSGLSPHDLALANPQSETIVSVSGMLDQIIDLRSAKALKKFVNLIKGFKLSADVKQLATQFGDSPNVITTPDMLRDTLLEKNWRDRPVQGQVPSNSQIFGNLVSQSEIHGILYPSKLTGKDCLAIYTQNFSSSDCYIEFDDAPPDARIPQKIDSSNFTSTSKTFEELIKTLN